MYLVFYGSERLRKDDRGWRSAFKSFDTFKEALDAVQRINREYPDELAWGQIVHFKPDGSHDFAWEAEGNEAIQKG